MNGVLGMTELLLGTPLSVKLAEKITELTPGNLNHVFFTDSGSECADTAVKMVRAYWRLKGQSTKIGRASCRERV